MRVYLIHDHQFNYPYHTFIGKLKKPVKGNKFVMCWKRQTPFYKNGIVVKYKQVKQESIFKITKKTKNIYFVELYEYVSKSIKTI